MIIGITGKARAGKDTFARLLCEQLGDATTLAFADPLKEGLAVMLGLTEEQLNGDLKEVPIERYGGASPRLMLQTLGTEWGRNLIDPDIWVKVALDRARSFCAHQYTIITDVRFDEEAMAIALNEGVVLGIERPGAGQVLSHSSEAGVRSTLIYHTVYNTGGLEHLEHEAELAAIKVRQYDSKLKASGR